MKVLLTAFYGKYNSSNMLVNMIDTDVDKFILTNSFIKLEQELNNVALEEYDLILMFGINKILKDEIKIKNTCRISLYLYNTKEEIDYLVKILSNPKIKEEII